MVHLICILHDVRSVFDICTAGMSDGRFFFISDVFFISNDDDFFYFFLMADMCDICTT